MDNLIKNNIIEVYKKGSYFNPATDHYGVTGTICCDVCGKKNLVTCIGYKQTDVCLECISKIDLLQQFHPKLKKEVKPESKFEKKV